MARYTETIQAPHSAEAVWHYLADLRSVEQWDPSIEQVELTGGEPRAEGASYELQVRFRGRTVTLPYRITEVDPPYRVVFEAETGSVRIRDEARVEPIRQSASRVTWDANLRLRGIRRLLDLPLRAIFNRVGEDASKGLGERLRKPTLDGPFVQVRR